MPVGLDLAETTIAPRRVPQEVATPGVEAEDDYPLDGRWRLTIPQGIDELRLMSAIDVFRPSSEMIVSAA